MSRNLCITLSHHRLKRERIMLLPTPGHLFYLILFHFCSWKLRPCSVPSPLPARPTAPSMSQRSWARAQLISSHKPGRKVISALGCEPPTAPWGSASLAVHCNRNGAFSLPCLLARKPLSTAGVLRFLLSGIYANRGSGRWSHLPEITAWINFSETWYISLSLSICPMLVRIIWTL